MTGSLYKGRSLPTTVIPKPFHFPTFYDPLLSSDMETQGAAGNICQLLHKYSFTGHVQTVYMCKLYFSKHDLKCTRTNILIRPIMQTILLYYCGDIKANPGPTAQKELCVAQISARSIKNKVDLLEAESNNFDIITSSETWLSRSDSNSSIHLSNFREPV